MSVKAVAVKVPLRGLIASLKEMEKRGLFFVDVHVHEDTNKDEDSLFIIGRDEYLVDDEDDRAETNFEDLI